LADLITRHPDHLKLFLARIALAKEVTAPLRAEVYK